MLRVLSKQIRASKTRPTQSRVGDKMSSRSYVLSWTFINLQLFSGKRKVTRFIVPISQIRKLNACLVKKPLGPGAWLSRALFEFPGVVACLRKHCATVLMLSTFADSAEVLGPTEPHV